MPITTHVLDTSLGHPAEGVGVVLETLDPSGGARMAGRGRTDADGRVRSLVDGIPGPGVYRLTFETRFYFEAQGVATFYPYVVVVFEVTAGQGHYHVPLLLSPFGYSTYRGS